MPKIEAQITLGAFDYRSWFPNSPLADKFEAMAQGAMLTESVPRFAEFAQEWFEECRVGWKASYTATVRISLDTHLIPHFGRLGVNRISKADLLKFRASLAKDTSRNQRALSNRVVPSYISLNIKNLKTTLILI